MAELIGIYFGSVTANGTGGTRASEGNDANPILTDFLNTAANDVGSPIRLAIRCNDSFYTGNDTFITPTGNDSAFWALAPNSGNDAGTFGNWGAALTFTSAITDVNTLFWTKAKVVDTEGPGTDKSVDLVISANMFAEL